MNRKHAKVINPSATAEAAQLEDGDVEAVKKEWENFGLSDDNEDYN